jgi:hypothetical protein
MSFIITNILLSLLVYSYMKRTKTSITPLQFLVILSYFSYSVLPLLSGYEITNVNDYEYYVFILGSLLSFLFIAFSVKISKSNANLLDFRSFVIRLNNISFRTYYFLVFLFLSTVYYFYAQYGVLFRLAAGEDANESSVYAVLFSSVLLPLLYLILSVSLVKIIVNNHVAHKILIASVLLFIFMFLLFTGRRDFILGLFFVFFIVSITKGINFYQIKYIPVALTFLMIVVLGSNIYQSIRFNTWMMVDNPSLFFQTIDFSDAAFDFDKTETNLTARTTALDFNLFIVNQYIFELKTPIFGAGLWQELINSIPSILLPFKEYVNWDTLIAENLRIRETDFPTTIIGQFIADFSILGFFFYSLVILLYLKISLWFLNILRNSQLLFSINYVLLVYSISNIEASLGGLLLSLRTMLFFVGVYFTIQFIKKSKRIRVKL